MRHRLKGRKLGMTDSHRRSVFANMACSLIVNEQIRTTLPRAKELRGITDKLITLAKGGRLHQRRAAMSQLQDHKAVNKMWTVLAPRYKDRNGGYTRVLKMGVRYGDCAPMAVIELVERDVDAKGKEDKARHEAQVAAAKSMEQQAEKAAKEAKETKGTKKAKESKESKESKATKGAKAPERKSASEKSPKKS